MLIKNFSIEDQLYRYLSWYKKMPDSIKRLLCTPFTCLPSQWRLGAVYHRTLEEARMMENAPAERIIEYQWLKLAALLQHAYKSVPFYRRTFDEWGIDLRRLHDWGDFQLLPMITRMQVQSAPDQFLSDRYPRQQRLKARTGGSSGEPLTLCYLKNFSRAAEKAHMHHLWQRIGYHPNETLARLRGDFLGANRFCSYDPWRRVLMLSSHKLNSENAVTYLQLLKKHDVTYLSAYPSSLFNLIQLVKNRITQFSLRGGLLLGSENIFPYQLKVFKEFFATERIFYWYGHGELGALAGCCLEEGRYHFQPTYGYVEFATPSISTPLATDTREIVSTGFINPLMPLIRYRTGDLAVEADSDCLCGRHNVSAAAILGRDQNIAIGLNGEAITLTGLGFDRQADYFNHILKMQIVNYAPGYLLVKVVPGDTFRSFHQREIIHSLTIKKNMPFHADMELVSQITDTNRGKSRFFVRTFAT